MRLLALLFAASACVTPSDPLDACGTAPNAPGIVASFDGDTAMMSRTDYIALVAWRDDIAAWSVCVGEAPL